MIDSRVRRRHRAVQHDAAAHAGVQAEMKAMVLNRICSEEIKSVANVARRDVSEFLGLETEIPIRPEVQEFRLEDANRALIELKEKNPWSQSV